MKIPAITGEAYRPRYVFQKISDITPAFFLSTGAKAAAVDLDNTLVYDGSFTPFPDAVQWVNGMKAAGIPVILFTNTYTLRAHVLSKKFGLDYISPGRKPAPDGFAKCAMALKTPFPELAMIGDQLLTDVRGANNVGAISMLVRPRHREILLFFRYIRIRRAERDYLRRIGMEAEK